MRLLALAAGLILLIAPTAAHAAGEIVGYIMQFSCVGGTDLFPGLVCSQPGTFFNSRIGMLTSIFNGFLFFMLVVYGLILVSRARREDSVQEALVAYSNALLAAILAVSAGALSEAFVLTGTGFGDSSLPDPEPAVEILLAVTNFIVGLAFAALTANIVIQGLRIIISLDEGGVEEARKNLFRSIVGGFLLKLSTLIIPGLRPSQPDSFVDVIVGLTNFAATLFGALAVIALIAAGIMLVISVEEALKERAKKLIITALIALVVVLLAKGIVSFLILPPTI